MSRQCLTRSPEKAKQRIAHRESRSVPSSSFQEGFHTILQLQRTMGNRRVAQLLQAKRLQTWGEITGPHRNPPLGAVHDKYEQEADHLAEQSSSSDGIAAHSMQRTTVPEKDKDQEVQNNPLVASITLMQPNSTACSTGSRKESGTDPIFFAIQRRIIVNGKPYKPTAKYYAYLKKNFGSHMKEFVRNMHNSGKPPEFSFKSYEQMGWEVRVRDQAIKGMGSTAPTASNCCSYPTDVHSDGYLDDTYWEKIGRFHFIIKSPMPAGKGPADAIGAIFMPGAGTELDCNSMMVAVQYYSILKAIGDERFNARFPGGNGIVIERVLSRKAEDKINMLKVQRVYKRVEISSYYDLLPGDWVYFKNVPDYSKKHVGFWGGLHAVYLGGDKFSGFGLYNLTNDEIMFLLLEEYNRGLKESEKKTVHDVIGIRKDLVRRPIVESYMPET